MKAGCRQSVEHHEDVIDTDNLYRPFIDTMREKAALRDNLNCQCLSSLSHPLGIAMIIDRKVIWVFIQPCAHGCFLGVFAVKLVKRFIKGCMDHQHSLVRRGSRLHTLKWHAASRLKRELRQKFIDEEKMIRYWCT